MIVLWLATGVLAKQDSAPSPTAPGGGGYVRFSGKFPDWFTKRNQVREEAERQLVRREKRRVDTSNVTVDLEPDLTLTEPEIVWADLGETLRAYGDYLKPSMTALDLFLEAQTRRDALEALRKLRIQLEDEIVLVIAANV